MGNGTLPPGSGAIIVPLQYIGAAEMATILRPMVPGEAILRVDTLRNLALWGVPPQWGPFAAWTAASALCAYAGYRIFQRLRRAFADVM